MIIKRLKLENYRRFRSLEVEYPENLIGIIGKNGTGKSTIIEAIGWSLYGNRMSRTDKLDIRSQFCDPGDKCRVEMDFHCAGTDYRIIRTLKGKNAISEAAIYHQEMEQPVAEQDRGVNEFVETLIGLDYKSFIASVFAKQKELAVLSTMQPEERRRSINRLIGIDVVDRAKENVRRDRNEKSAFCNGLQAALKDVAKIKTEIAELAEQIVIGQKKLSEASLKLDLYKLKLSEAKAHYEKIRQLRDRYIDYSNRIEKYTGLLSEAKMREQQQTDDLNQILQAETIIQALEPQVQKYDAIAAEKSRLDEDSVKFASLQAKLREQNRLKDHIEKEQKRLNELEVRLAALGDTEALILQLGNQLEQFEALESELQQQIQKAHGQTHAITEKGKEVREKQAKVKELGPDGQCPVCTQILGKHFDQVIGNFSTELKSLRENYKQSLEAEEKLTQELSQLKQQLKQLRHQRENATGNQRMAQELKKSLAVAAQSVEQLKMQASILSQEIAELGELTYDNQHHLEINKKYKELTELVQKSVQLNERISRKGNVEKSLRQVKIIQENYQKEIKNAVAQCDELHYDESLFTDARDLVEKRTSEYDQGRDLCADLKQDLSGLEKERTMREAEIIDQEAKRAQIAALETEIVYLDALDQYLGDFRRELAGRIRPLIAAQSSELLAITTDGRYSQVELDEDYNIFVYDGTQSFPMARFSGGEQDLVNLCLRVAISQVLTERGTGTAINFIVLDEIFGSQDEDRKGLILTALNKLQTQFRQIFIITHIDSIKDLLPVLLQVEEVNEFESSARMI